MGFGGRFRCAPTIGCYPVLQLVWFIWKDVLDTGLEHVASQEEMCALHTNRICTGVEQVFLLWRLLFLHLMSQMLSFSNTVQIIYCCFPNVVETCFPYVPYMIIAVFTWKNLQWMAFQPEKQLQYKRQINKLSRVLSAKTIMYS